MVSSHSAELKTWVTACAVGGQWNSLSPLRLWHSVSCRLLATDVARGFQATGPHLNKPGCFCSSLDTKVGFPPFPFLFSTLSSCHMLRENTSLRSIPIDFSPNLSRNSRTWRHSDVIRLSRSTNMASQVSCWRSARCQRLALRGATARVCPLAADYACKPQTGLCLSNLCEKFGQQLFLEI